MLGDSWIDELRSDHVAQVIDHLRKELQAASLYPSNYFSLGAVHMWSGDYRSALAHFDEQIRAEAASKKLIDSKETIIVSGDFTGHPKQGTEVRYLDIKSGDVVLGDVQQEIRPGETAIFDQLNLNADALAQIDSQGPHILMDIYSGRRSSKNNLLDCDYYDGSFESIRGRTIVIRCQLIEERFPRSGR